LPEAERSFNQTVLYGKDATKDMVFTVARRFPMMAAYQVVLLKEAQYFKDLEEELLSYVENPMPSTILVICYKYKSIDKRKKFLKVAAEKGIVFDSPKIYENQLISWINQYCSEKNYKIAAQSSALLAEYLGTDISKAANELDKLMILLPEGSTLLLRILKRILELAKILTYTNCKMQ
jgi:DNA polymerase III subunit delta